MNISAINNSTKLCAVYGYPVKHSLSPVMHNAAFSFLGLNYIYLAFNVRPENLEAAMQAITALDFAGVNITIPHKEKVTPYLQQLDRTASLTGAVNTVVNTGGELTGYNTDGPGFLQSLEEDLNFSPHGRTVLMVGAGGAARAVGIQLGLAGAAVIGIINRREERARALAQSIERATTARAEVLPWPEDPAEREGWLDSFWREADLVINCTPLGMQGSEDKAPPLPYHLLKTGQFAYDIVYSPPETPFMTMFRQRGCRVANGIGMLLHQGALAFECWTGKKAPLPVMRKALAAALASAARNK